MPTCLVLAMQKMIPRLEAEESVLAANRIAVGGGKLKKETAEAIVREWSEHLPKGRKGAPGVGGLAAAGFKVVRHKVPPKKN